MMPETLFVLSKGLPGREEDYRNWYVTQHLPDMKRVPGVADGRLFAFTGPVEGAPWQMAGEYPLDATVGTVLGAIGGRAGTDAMPLTDAIDGASVVMLAATPRGPRMTAADGVESSGTVLFVTMSNAVDGQDDAFNDWYDNRHIPDVLAVPGMVAAQRFDLAPETAGKASPWRYFARYEVAAVRVAEAMGEVTKRAGTDAMPLTPAMRMEGGYMAVFAPLA
jgi:hypothetical protein